MWRATASVVGSTWPRQSQVARGIPRAVASRIAAPSSADEKQPGWRDELERVPLDRIVARRDRQPAGGVVVIRPPVASSGSAPAPTSITSHPTDCSAAITARWNIGPGDPAVPTDHDDRARSSPAGARIAQAPNPAAYAATTSGVRPPTRPRTPDTLTISPVGHRDGVKLASTAGSGSLAVGQLSAGWAHAVTDSATAGESPLGPPCVGDGAVRNRCQERVARLRGRTASR